MTTIENVELFGLDSSIFRSGYSMRDTAPTPQEFQETVATIRQCREAGDYTNPHIKRAIKLASLSEGGTISSLLVLWSTLT